MRILYITPDFPPSIGGIQTYAVQLCRALHKQVSSLHVLAPRHRLAQQVDELLPFTVHRHWSTDGLMRWFCFNKICELAQTHNLDTIVTSGWYTAAMALNAEKKGIVKKVFTAAHGQELLSFPVPFIFHRLYEKHRAWVLRNVDGIFPVSSYTASLLKPYDIPEEKIHMLTNGVDFEGWNNLRKQISDNNFKGKYNIGNVPVISTVARLVSRKGVDTVIEAIAQIKKEIPEITYVIAGSGPDSEKLKKRARDFSVEKNCIFTGRIEQSDIAALYNESDIFVMPSRDEPPSIEGFGLVFREANMFETPVIGSTAGGIPDAVIDGINGLLIPPDNPAALAKAVLKLLKDKKLAQKLGREGKKLIQEEGTWDHVAEKLIKIVQTC